MKTWYRAVCDHHKEMADIFVNNPETTYHYFHGPNGERKDKGDFINKWLQIHYGCHLRLIHNDVDMDACFNAGVRVIKCYPGPDDI